MHGNWTSDKHFDDIAELLSMLDMVLQCVGEGIYITDGDANTIMVNEAYEAISGLNRQDVLGRHMSKLVQSGVINSSGTLLALESRKTVHMEQKFRTGRRAIITSTPLLDDAGNILLVVTNVRDITETHQLKKQLVKEEELTQKQLREIEVIRKQIIEEGDLIAVDENMLRTVLMADKVAKMDTMVLLLGETGVGKEKIASYIHENSDRAGERLIKVNCGAISEQLIESELFGYERGSFTGAVAEGKPGLFEVADNGTIFLDEIGELPMDMQVKLLRVLQDREVQRVGGTKSRKVNVRILAATNRDLEEMVRQNRFRKDLYYRLSVFPITVPPLRHRRGDIVPLAESMLQELGRKYSINKTLSDQARHELLLYDWPGNVRELRNIVERAMILSAENIITPNELAIFGPRSTALPQDGELPDEPVNLKAILEQVESSYIQRAYDKHRNVRRAAGSLSMDAATYVRKRKKYTGGKDVQT